MRLMMLLALAACGDKDGTDTGATTDDTAAATDDTASDEVCEAVTWIDGNSGTYTVSSAAESDVKHHWRMGEDITRIETTVTWDEPDWNMEVQTGIGTCPDSGDAYGLEEGTGGSLTVVTTPADVDGGDTFEAEKKWFVHFTSRDGGLDDGMSTDYTMEVLACKAAR